MDRISNYRQITVLIHPGKEVTMVAVLTRRVVRGQRADRCIWRGMIPEVPKHTTMADVMRAASRALNEAAGRL